MTNDLLSPDFFDPEGVDCVHFNGYKPCFPGISCAPECARRRPFGLRVLIVNLDALGDVLMTTAQLAGMRRVMSGCHITWLTLPMAVPLLEGNPLVDAVVAWTDVNRMILLRQRFDVILNADKSREACAFTAAADAPDKRGFTLSRRGQVIPANPAAGYNFRMGIDDELKFRINQRTGQDILAETWELPYDRAEYVLVLSDEEKEFCARKKTEWDLDGRTVVGFNTGCSELFPNKKMTVDQHVAMITMLADRTDAVFLLLGGRSDASRNAEIHSRLPQLASRLIATPVDEGLRRGMCYENLADVVVTGDSFGMHLAIALQKQVLVWFGLSCWTEIDLYERGWKFFHPDLACSPCWKRACPFNLECISMLPIGNMADTVAAFTASLPNP